MAENIALFREDEFGIMVRATEEHQPVKSFVLFSGGNDSTVLAHWAAKNRYADALVHIDTGTALPGVREFVERFATFVDLPLLVYEAGNEYERMVLGEGDRQGPRKAHGFPGPASHRFAYVRLKERQIARLIRDHKEKRTDRIMLLTGVRRAESVRRMGTTKAINREGAAVWVAPLIDWTNEEMRYYREVWSLPQSDVAALMHRSGECNCGCFAAPGERQDIATFYPEFDRWLTDLERRAEAMGLEHCRWGVKPDGEAAPAGPMCSDCQLRMDVAA